jgi:hypothetical protein
LNSYQNWTNIPLQFTKCSSKLRERDIGGTLILAYIKRFQDEREDNKQYKILTSKTNQKMEK